MIGIASRVTVDESRRALLLGAGTAVALHGAASIAGETRPGHAAAAMTRAGRG
jgi:hypothetical protein